jgi:putative secretion ATPase (PEP-CTERM system associated)
MYEQQYGFSGKPFQLNPDPGFFFDSAGHRRAMSYLRYGLQQRQGFIVVTGDIGTGKTMLVSTLFRELDLQKIVAARIVSSNVDDHDLLRLVAAQFQIEWDGVSKAALLTRLEAFFRQCAADGKRVLLVVDEAQNMPRSALEELRMLSNFEQDGQPLVQSFLLGQREFRTLMRSPGLEQLRQRVAASYHLKPLTAAETEIYIRHRLGKVGWHGDPQIEPDVYAGVYQFTEGVPRRINALMDRLLLNASLDGAHELTFSGLRSVTQELSAEQTGSEAPPPVLPLPPRAESPAPLLEPAADEIHRLEARLAAMQRAYDNLAGEMVKPAPPPLPGADLPDSRWSWPRVMFATGALGAVLVGGFVLLRVL